MDSRIARTTRHAGSYTLNVHESPAAPAAASGVGP